MSERLGCVQLQFAKLRRIDDPHLSGKSRTGIGVRNGDIRIFGQQAVALFTEHLFNVF